MEDNLVEVTAVREAVERARSSKSNKVISSRLQSDTAYFSSPFGDHPKVAEPSVTNAGDAVTSQMTFPSDVMLVSAPLERSSKGVKSVLESSETMLPTTRSMAKPRLRTNKAEHAGIKRSKLKRISAQEPANNKSEII